jgi:hypothetical protein
MKEASVTVGAANTVNVKLVTSSQTLEEVVVVGYGTQKKKDLIVPFPSIKGAAIQNLVTQVLKVNSPVELLEFKTSATGIQEKLQSQNWVSWLLSEQILCILSRCHLLREQWFLH